MAEIAEQPSAFIEVCKMYDQLIADLAGSTACRGCVPLCDAIEEVNDAFIATRSRTHHMAERAEAMAKAAQLAQDVPLILHGELIDDGNNIRRLVADVSAERLSIEDDAARITPAIVAIRAGLEQCRGRRADGSCGLDDSQRIAAFLATPPPVFFEGRRIE